MLALRRNDRLIWPAALLSLGVAALACSDPTITGGGPGGGGGGHVARRVHITGQPSAVIHGQVISPPVRVVVADSDLIAITSSTAPITLSVVGTTTDTLRGVLIRNAASGTAIFDGLVLDSTGSYRIVATSPGLASDTSEQFTVGTEVSDTIVVDLGNTASDTVEQVAFTSERNLSVNPAVDTLPVGGVVKWHWRGSLTHGVLVTSGNLVYSTGNFTAPTDIYLDMPNAGTFTYECSVHGAAMTGSIVVR